MQSIKIGFKLLVLVEGEEGMKDEAHEKLRVVDKHESGTDNHGLTCLEEYQSLI